MAENATKMLSKEHKNILKVVEALQNECSNIEGGKAVDLKFFKEAVDFIKNYADKFHHAKEEDILFKELCKDSVEMHCNPTQQMIFEHEEGRKFVKGIQEGLEKNSKNLILENARNYAGLLQEHIYKEDNILYPMADNALNAKAQAEILERFKEAERKKFPNGVKEKYLALAKEFEKRVKAGKHK